MDIAKIIQNLRKELARVEEALALLEGQASRTRNPRGRKSMGEEERQQVSARMKAYWERRRAKAAPRTKSRGASGS